MSGDWRGTLWTLLVTFCIVIIRCTATFWSLCIMPQNETSPSLFIIKPTRCTDFSNLFWNETLQVSDSSSVHYQELSTVHSAMVYVMQICTQLSSGTRMELQFYPDSAARKLSVWRTPLLSVQWITPDNGQRNCPKHVEFHSKINLRNCCVYLVLLQRNLSRCTVAWT
jgi:hypothetical protein